MDEHDDDLSPEVEEGAEMETERYADEADEDVDEDVRGEQTGEEPAHPMKDGDTVDDDAATPSRHQHA